MKSRANDPDDEIDLTESGFKKRFRTLREDELHEIVRQRRVAARRKLKDRVTIYFDSDIVSSFRKMGEREGVGYQTLMNEALRRVVDGMESKETQVDLKEEILNDKKFLQKLKSALSA